MAENKKRIVIEGITPAMRQKIINNSVIPLPANVSERGITAKQLQEMIVAPVTGERESIISEFNRAIDEVEDVLNEFDGVTLGDLDERAEEIEQNLNDEFSLKTSSDAVTTDITYTLSDNSDKTFSASGITKINTVIPATAAHGFCAGLNFRSAAAAPEVTFINNSAMPLQIIKLGMKIGVYVPTPDRTVTMVFFCDGLNIYCYLSEV